MYSLKLLNDIQSLASSDVITAGKYHELVSSIDNLVINIKGRDDESRMIRGRLRGISSLLAMLLIGEVFGGAYDAEIVRRQISNAVCAIGMDGNLAKFISNNH